MGALAKIIKDLSNLDVLVGIPENDATRQSGDGINNAELAYIHTNGIRQNSMIEEMQPELDKGTPYSAAHQMYIQAHGSPLWHSPPRPIIEPAIEYKPNKEAISKQLGMAAKKALSGDQQGTKDQLSKAGLLAQNLVRDWFTNPANNWPLNTPATIEAKGSDMPLINSGQLRKSITFVVRDEP
jgi:hypothetical protein